MKKDEEIGQTQMAFHEITKLISFENIESRNAQERLTEKLI